MLVIGLDWRSE